MSNAEVFLAESKFFVVVVAQLSLSQFNEVNANRVSEGENRQVLPCAAVNDLSSLRRPVASCPQLSIAGWEHGEDSLGRADS